jgi:hypothetical protein
VFHNKAKNIPSGSTTKAIEYLLFWAYGKRRGFFRMKWAKAKVILA